MAYFLFMEYVFIVFGALLYGAIVLDILKTTLSLQGGGWLTSPLAHRIWMLFLKASGSRGRSGLLEHAGYIILVLILLVWVLGLWSSFFLLLLSQSDSIINSSTRFPADPWGKFYYAGFTLSTLGVGDYVASQSIWRVLTDWFALNGLVLITTSITYLLPVLSAVLSQRQLAILFSSLGQSPQEMVLNSWDGKSFHRLVAQASDLAGMLLKHSQNHKAYPVIHYFHTHKPQGATVLQIARLQEALLLLNRYVKQELRPSLNDLSSLQTAVDNYVEVITEVATLKDTSRVPPQPAVDKLVEAGLVAPHQTNVPLEDEIQHKRRVMATLVEQDGWPLRLLLDGRA